MLLLPNSVILTDFSSSKFPDTNVASFFADILILPIFFDFMIFCTLLESETKNSDISLRDLNMEYFGVLR